MGFHPSSKLSTTNEWWAELWWKHVPDGWGCNVETLSAELCSCRRDTHVVAFCRTKICPTRNCSLNYFTYGGVRYTAGSGRVDVGTGQTSREILGRTRWRHNVPTAGGGITRITQCKKKLGPSLVQLWRNQDNGDEYEHCTGSKHCILFTTVVVYNSWQQQRRDDDCSTDNSCGLTLNFRPY